ncbi:MAG: TolC family protein, partial [Amphiplicatus sp.]
MHRGGVLAALAVLAGCASLDEERLQSTLPDAPPAWTAQAGVGGAPTGDWVAAFSDEALYGLIDEAMRHNNNLQIAAANLKAARAGAHVARAALFPALNAGANASRNAIVTDASVAAQTGGGTTRLRPRELEDMFGLDANGDGKLDGLDLDGDGVIDAALPKRRVYINNFGLFAQWSWEIDLWGRLTDQTKAAYRQARASLADYRAARLAIAGAVAQGWFGLVESRLQRELAERDVAARESNLRVTERRYERGVASSLDVRLARSALGSSQANLAFRQRAEKEDARRLEVLLGRYPAAELEAAEALPALHALAGAGAPGEILARRPDLIAAESRMVAAGLEARAARKQLLPRITLSSQVSASGPLTGDTLDPDRLAG